ncbi:tetratricopeptide repeat protein [[Phormidium] sp. ETS-05]|uniref:eIF2A-related protein n=1 Tax=[Phormidium] sp. ETS-05 TaxID=222819 RepID=UPI0018EEEAED|nr:tetratricopeptide repeat protein [[Phormidium] sp. ETS-05]
MVFGLAAVTDRDRLLSWANQVREEFRHSFPFPLVLWVNDDLLKTMRRSAPDFHSWAVSVEFPPDREAIAAAVTITARDWFANQLQLKRESALKLQEDLKAAQKDLSNSSYPLEEELAANLESLLGAVKFSSCHTNAALEHYQNAAQLWQQCQNLERLGKIYLEIAVCNYIEARKQHSLDDSDWQLTRQAVSQCLAAYEQTQKPELIADSLGTLGKILRQLGDWETLQTLAENALSIHTRQNRNPEIARDYGFLAEVALAGENWSQAQELAAQALEIIQPPPANPNYDVSWYYFILAQTEAKLNNPDQAIAYLQTAKTAGNPDDDIHLYLQIISELQRLYFQQEQYIPAFDMKIKLQSLEQQYGLRAFVGASLIKPQRRENFGIDPGEWRESVATEIANSGRMLDVEKLIDRLSQNLYKIIVIHGQSGVGKSSLVNGGLIPALKQKTIGYQEVLPVAVRSYRDWVTELGRSLAESLGEKGIKIRPFESEDLEIQLAFFRKQLQENEKRNFRTILIFDQFEEFFFAGPKPCQRQAFFQFIGNCLNILTVKVILSLREDYLHKLLEWEVMDSMKIIGHDILNAKIRYPLGNFSPEDAEKIIKRLTQNTQFRLDDDLRAALVKDLAAELEAVRPIELQIVGAQLQTEKITTLADYRQWGPKTEFVKRYLASVVADCGQKNQHIAELVLYLLTDGKGTRPLKTRAELERDLRSFAVDLTEQPSPLCVVLRIFVKSGLVLIVPEKPDPRYQLFHDYLAEFIRLQQHPRLEQLIAKLEQERKQRQLAEAQRQQTEKELQQAEQAKQILEQAHHKATQRIRLGTGVFAVSLMAAAIASGLAWKANQTLQEARSGTQLEREGLNALRKFEVYQIEGLVSAMQVGQDLKALVGNKRPLADYPTTTPMLALHTIVSKISERNQLWHQDSVLNAHFSPDGQLIITTSSDNTARLWDSRGKLVAILTGHRGPVKSASFSPDGKRIVTASDDKTARIWDTTGKELAPLIGHQSAVISTNFSPDGHHIVTASSDNTARVWNRSGQLVATLIGHQSAVISTNFSPDGRHIVTASLDNTARVWDITGQEIATLTGHRGWVNRASFSPDGHHIVTASLDNTARVWDITGQEVAQLTGHRGRVFTANFSPDGKHIVTASSDKTARIWETTGKLVAQLSGHQGSVNSATFSPDGKRIVTASDDNTARIWETTGKHMAALTGHQGSVFNASFSPDGEHIVTASLDNTAQIWDTTDKLVAPLTGHQGRVRSASFSPDGQHIVTASWDNTARVWDSRGKLVAALTGHQDWVRSASFSPDGQRIVTASSDKTARIWDSRGKLLAILSGHQGSVRSASFSPDGHHIVTASDDNTARVWDTKGKLVAILTGHQDWIFSASFSPDGERIVTASSDNTARVWESTGKLVAVLNGHQGWVRSAIFSPDGQRIVTASSDDTARVWDSSGKLLAVLSGHHGRVRSASFSPDGKRIVTASLDNTARIWDTTGKLLAELTGHQGWVFSASFSPDGEHIVTASLDNTARVWDTTGKLVAELTGHQGWVISASFSPDGKRIVTASDDNTARVWPLGNLDELLAWGCDWLQDYLVTHPKELEKLKICQNPSNLAAAALVLVREGEEQARAGDMDAAMAKFQKALQWNADLDFEPKAKAQQQRQ